ncbi:12568_t:CDS:1, partial [Gigaspora rosea]
SFEFRGLGIGIAYGLYDSVDKALELVYTVESLKTEPVQIKSDEN